jgi:glutamate synthase (NADPH/NADH) small chain
MDDPYGFMRYPRREPGKELVTRRIRHWHEYVRIMPDRQVACQANRCMDCGTPYCHSYCPVHNLIPDWNDLVNEESWQRAWQQLDSTNNFPELTGRLCPAPCEDACTLSLADHPVTIKSIEQAVAERAWQKGWVQPQPIRQQRAQRVAIIGSGPAGLACAQQLARVGYQVTVYEQEARPGGLLRYGIPDFRLEKGILDRRLKQLVAEGVRFRTGVRVGATIEIEELQRSTDAVVLACGCRQPRDVPVPGRELKGIYFALDYLSQQNHRVAGDVIEPEAAILAKDKDVVVIGGGDTGADCVGTAIRQGAKKVTQVQYHERPTERADVLRHWPKPVPKLRSTDTEAEGCQRIWGWDTIEFEHLGERVAGVRLQRMEWTERADGSWDKWPLPGQLLYLPAQLVLIAAGYAHPFHTGLLEHLGLGLDAHGNVLASDTDYQTDEGGVFACGDMRRGQSLIVWAIREGRQCAQSVDVWLTGSSDLPRV